MNVDLMVKVLQLIRSDLKHFNLRELVRSTACGTVACVIGHACMLPEAEAVGYSVKHWKGSYDLAVHRGEEAMMTFEFATIGAQLFGVTEREAFDLFCVPGESNFDSGDASYEACSPSQHLAVFERRLAQFCAQKGIDSTAFNLPQP